MNRFFTFAALAVCLAACADSKHVLFNNGVSEYSIVVDPAAGESVQYAACQLQHWISEVSGVTLPIVGPDGGQAGRRMYGHKNEMYNIEI